LHLLRSFSQQFFGKAMTRDMLKLWKDRLAKAGATTVELKDV
jgi:hypothetical protein